MQYSCPCPPLLLSGANPEKARELAADNSPAGSPEAEAKGAKGLFSKK